ncbi:MAG: tetratricopeptide repeat protein [Sphingobium sp.]
MRHVLSAPSVRVIGAALLFAMGTAAAAQTVPIDTRVDRLEREVRAVQRKVFPAGVPIEPEITRAPATASGTGSAAPMADLMARVTGLESQLASITGQVEQNSFKLKQLEDAFNKYKADTEGRLLQPDPPATRPTMPASATGAVAVDPLPAKPAPAPAKSAAAATAPAKPAPAPVSEERKAAVAAIERPSTGDAPLDSYSYGYRLWDAKFYPEAQVQLQSTVAKYGSSPIASRAQNLLGRAYLDDGKPALASVAFYENYQKRPRGDRAPDSLTYLGEALIQLKKPEDACKVYAELDQVYGATLSASLRGIADKGKVKAKCS